jgi:disulfide bond formation protein DsbB
MFVETIITILSYLTVLGDLFLLASLIIMISKRRLLKGHYKNVSKHSLTFAFIIALIAASGSLFFSEIAGFVPCKLCWFQRIFMYPQVILLGIAAWKKEDIRKYALPLLIIGVSISIYHYGLQVYTLYHPISSVCDASGVSCANDYIFQLGYITIPMMALTAFLMIIFFLTLYSPAKNKK